MTKRLGENEIWYEQNHRWVFMCLKKYIKYVHILLLEIQISIAYCGVKFIALNNHMIKSHVCTTFLAMNVENVTNTIFPFGAQVNKNRSNVVSFVRLTLSDLLFIHLHLFHLLHRLPPPPPPPLLLLPLKSLEIT